MTIRRGAKRAAAVRIGPASRPPVRAHRIPVLVAAGLILPALAGAAAAQVPNQTPPPAPTAQIPDWQRPNTASADYAAGAKRDLDSLAEQLAERKQRANERGAHDALNQMQEVDRRLRAAREQWDKLLQTDQANWGTVRKQFELAYEDLMQAWNKVPQNF